MLFRKWSATLLLIFLTAAVSANGGLKVVSTFSDYASIAKEIGKDLIEVEYLSHGDQDPHFVPPKPSLALKLKDADLLIASGLDLEMWLATLQDKARNKNIMDGSPGFITVSQGIDILEKPTMTISRSEGDIHVLGNPHFHPSPVNWIPISENILIGLKRVDPQNAETYEKNQKMFVDKVYRALFGEELIQIISPEDLLILLKGGMLFEFLENEYEGKKYIDYLGGWLKKALPFRGKEMIAYHKNWSYFAKDFGLKILGFIEIKPGIPPTPKHVEDTIQLIKDRGVDVMLVASYFEKRKPMTIAQKTGIKALFLPLSVGALPGLDDNFKLVDYWIEQINQAVQPQATE